MTSGIAINIRTVTAADLDVIVAIERECYPYPWSYDMFRQELVNPVATFLCLTENDRISGYLCYWFVVGEMQILNLATAMDRQGQGIASRLLAYAFDQCFAKGLYAAWLEVRSGNSPAINLYQKTGFVQSGLRRGYYRDGEDAIIMVRKVQGQHEVTQEK